MKQTVESMLGYARKLVFVERGATVDKIRTLMLVHGVSLIPIIEGKGRRQTGYVRRKTMFRMLAEGRVIEQLSEIMEPGLLPEVEHGDSLDDAMKKLRNTPGLLVKDNDGMLRSMITPRVIATALADFTAGYAATEELELNIRKRLELVPAEALRDEVDLNRMTFADYHRLISVHWDTLKLDHLERKTVLELLDHAREFRNQVMHFNSYEEDLAAIAELRGLAKVLRVEVEHVVTTK